MSTTNQVSPTVTALQAGNKTPEQRKIELSSIISRIDASNPADMPVDVREVANQLAGMQFKLGDIVIDTVPTPGEWKSYTGKRGLVYTALDTFQTRAIGMINGKRVSVKISVQVA